MGIQNVSPVLRWCLAPSCSSCCGCPSGWSSCSCPPSSPTTSCCTGNHNRMWHHDQEATHRVLSRSLSVPKVSLWFFLCPHPHPSDAPVSELSLELLLLQVVLPALLEQGHTRQWLKGLVRAWTVSAGYLLWVTTICRLPLTITMGLDLITFPFATHSNSSQIIKLLDNVLNRSFVNTHTALAFWMRTITVMD